MEQEVADAAYFRATELAKRVVEHLQSSEAELKHRDRFNRRPTTKPLNEAVIAVLCDEQLDEPTTVFLLKELARTATPELSLAAADWLLSANSPLITKAVLDAALGVCCCLRFKPDAALKYYGEQLSRGMALDARSANMAVAACSHSGDVQGVQKVLDDMVRLHVPPNEFTATMALQACNYKRRGLYKEAIRMLTGLNGAAPPQHASTTSDTAATPTAASPASVAPVAQTAAAAAGSPAAPAAPAALPAAFARSHAIMDALLSVCEAAMDKAPSLEAAEEVFGELQALQLRDNTRAYNALMRACAKRGQWQRARVHFEAMAQNDVPADTHTFHAFIRACLAGGALDEALNVFEWLVSGRDVSESVPADIATYNTLIRACHQAGMLEKALEIMGWVASHGVAFDSATYEELIGTVEIAQLWDAKAVRGAADAGMLAVFPEQLRPAPFDGMRMMYLDHLEELQHEAALARAKLGSATGWAASTLMRGNSNLGGSGGGAGQGGQEGGGGMLFTKPKLPKILTPQSPVSLSRAPSFRTMTLDKLSKFSPSSPKGYPDGTVSPRTLERELSYAPMSPGHGGYAPMSPGHGGYAPMSPGHGGYAPTTPGGTTFGRRSAFDAAAAAAQDASSPSGASSAFGSIKKRPMALPPQLSFAPLPNDGSAAAGGGAAPSGLSRINALTAAAAGLPLSPMTARGLRTGPSMAGLPAS